MAVSTERFLPQFPTRKKPAIGLLYGLVPEMRIREDMVFSTFFYRNLRKGMIKTRSTP